MNKNQLSKSILFLLCTIFSFSADAVKKENTIQNKLEKANKTFKGEPDSKHRHSAANFRLNEQTTLIYNLSVWDTVTKTNYTYIQDSLVSELVASSNIGGVFVPSYRFIFIYDLQGRQTSRDYQFWNGSVYEKVSLYNTSYNSNGDQITETELNWNGASYDTSYATRYVYIYNGSNHMTSVTSQYSDLMGGWINDYQENYLVNAQGEWTDYIAKRWNDVLNVWENNEHIYNITWYNFSNMDFLTATIQFWNGSMFEDDFKFTQTFNGAGSILTSLEELWNGSAWENSEKTSYTYMNNLPTSVVYEEWSGNWLFYEKEETAYDANSNIITQEFFEWVTGAWRKFSGIRHTYVYDIDNNMVSNIIEDYDDISMTWHYLVQFLYSYDNLSSVAIVNKSEFSIYPNPANDIISIKGSLEEIKEIKIYDVSGSLIQYINSLDQLTTVDVSQMKKGIYFIQIITDKNQSSSRFIKL